MANSQVNGSDKFVKFLKNEMQQAMEIDMLVAQKLDKMPIGGCLNMVKQSYIGILANPKCPIFLKNKAEQGLVELDEEAALISRLVQRMEIAYPDPKNIPEQAKMAVNVIKMTVLSRYHTVAKLVTAYHFHMFNENHGLEIESMASKLGVQRDKSMVEEWLFKPTGPSGTIITP